MSNREQARQTLLHILNSLDELEVDLLVVAFTTSSGKMGFGGAGLTSVTLSGLADYLKTAARQQWTSQQPKQFQAFPPMQDLSGVKPS